MIVGRWLFFVGAMLTAIAQSGVAAAQAPDALLHDPKSDVDPASVPVDNSSLAPHLYVPSEDVSAPAPDAAAELSLDDVSQLAANNHPKLLESAADARAARGVAFQVGLYPNPQFNTASPQLAANNSQYNVYFGQQIVTGHKLQLNRAAASRDVTKAELAQAQAWFDVMTGVRRKFYATLVAQQRVVILRHLVTITRGSRDASQKLLDAGEGSRGDLLLLDIEYEQSEIKLANAETYLEIDKQQLAIAAGVPSYVIGRLIGDLTIMTPPYDVSQLTNDVASVNTQAQQARVEVDRREVMLDRARVEPRPNVLLMGGYQNQVSPAQSQGLFQVTFDVPIWNRNQGNIRAAHANIQSALAESRSVELTLADQAAGALADYRAATQAVERYERQILPKARESLEVIKHLHSKGEIDFLRLLQAQQALIEADLSYIEAQGNRWDAAVTIAGLLQVDQFP